MIDTSKYKVDDIVTWIGDATGIVYVGKVVGIRIDRIHGDAVDVLITKHEYRPSHVPADSLSLRRVGEIWSIHNEEKLYFKLYKPIDTRTEFGKFINNIYIQEKELL